MKLPKIRLPKITNPFEPIDVPDMHTDYVAADQEYQRKIRDAHAHRFAGRGDAR